MRNIKLTIAYDGSNYSGWQIQNDEPTVQGEINRALSVMLKANIKIKGAGRTDAKAHAFRYTANFHTENQSVPIDKFPAALNSLIPRDIRVIKAELADDKFDAQFSAKAREYLYFIINKKQTLPHYNNFAYHIERPVNIELLSEACRLFEGRHDFKYFCYGYGNDKPNAERAIFYFRVKNVNNNIYFFIKGEGFLRGMIRTIISVCLAYSEEKLFRNDIIEALKGEKDIEQALKPAVPAKGLYFRRAFY